MSDLHELSVTRLIRATPETIWRIYTERTREWFCPRPWTTPEVDWDLRPGGRADVVLASPEGERHPYRGVFLEVVPNHKLVSTSAMTEGWVPQPGEMNFVRIDTFEPEGDGTRYTARARHWTEAAMQAHRDMGFEQGWGAVADQLAKLAEAAR
ncbi:SRPBCC family protein [uncultured Brevundimonas sp.]|uniref:SRPBCC family protein n=1 Tax=uncultured Brevundimonas sp. TaxID=213418 RepID=UPI0030EDC65B|tara:strand:- start:12534 stop:12992 length:459 start_codon:yes stop_codon:yes gene_type:complete